MKAILIVEDEFAIADLLREVLEEEGYHVDVAEHGQEALKLLGRSRPDLVLLDVMMPVMDGRALCRTMQAHADWRSIPVVMMSAGYRIVSPDECPYAAFLIKPFHLDEVLELVVRLIGHPDRPERLPGD